MMKLIKLFKSSVAGIRGRMMLYSLLVIVMSGIVSLYTSYSSSVLLSEIEAMFKLSVQLDGIEQESSKAHQTLTMYIELKSLEALNEFMESIETLSTSSRQLLDEYDYTPSQLPLKNISNMIARYIEFGSDAILAKRGRDISGSRESYLKATDTKVLIQEVVDNLKLEQLNQNIKRYKYLEINGKRVLFFNVLMVLAMMVLTWLIVYDMTLKMTTPIVQLSKAADEIAHGHFSGKAVVVDGNDEIKVMADAFNQMKKNIVSYIDELNHANLVETQLIEKELQNAKMQTLLNDAELRSLQSQINPHFLFNSLNAGVQLAMMEGADTTLVFLENLSTLFRCNIRPLNELVGVDDEIHHIRSYCELMKIRFGSKVSYDINLSETVKKQLILPMILQPLVENAFIHGIGKCEEGGHVSIYVDADDATIEFNVTDSGKGMSEDEILRIFNKDSSGTESIQVPKRSHSSGIGAGNVIQRLKLMYGDLATIAIESPGNSVMGTKVKIVMPFQGAEVADV